MMFVRRTAGAPMFVAAGRQLQHDLLSAAIAAVGMAAATIALVRIGSGDRSVWLALPLGALLWLAVGWSQMHRRRAGLEGMKRAGASDHLLVDMLWTEGMITAVAGIFVGGLIATRIAGGASWYGAGVMLVFAAAGVVPILAYNLVTRAFAKVDRSGEAPAVVHEAPVVDASSKGLRATGVGYHYRDCVALTDLELSVEPGKITSLLGPNGAGKTTLLRVLSGLLPPSSGRVIIDGRELRGSDGRHRAQIGYLAQRFSLYRDLTVRENLRFFGSVYGLDDDELATRLSATVSAAGLTSVVDRIAGHLSGGFQRRLALAACLIYRPRYMLLDEPLAGIDPLSRRIIWYLLGAAAAEGAGILVATHAVAEAENSDRVAILSAGRCVALGSVKDLKKSHPEDTVFRIECAEVYRAFAVLRRQLDDSADIITSDGHLRVNLARTRHDIRGVCDALATARIEVRNIQPAEPSLDNILFSYSTGNDVDGSLV